MMRGANGFVVERKGGGFRPLLWVSFCPPALSHRAYAIRPYGETDDGKNEGRFAKRPSEITLGLGQAAFLFCMPRKR